MKLILVATDGSRCADRAIDYAANLATQLAAALLIVHAWGRTAFPATR